MKKVLSVFLSILLTVSILPIGAFNLTASALTEGYYTYTVEDGKATITDVDTEISGDITIPSTLGGYPVTCIGEDAFLECIYIINVVIPDSVIKIEGYVFEFCINLKSVTFGKGLTSIGNAIFTKCRSLTSITVVEGNAVYYSENNCVIKKSTNELGVGCGSSIIPSSVTSIRSYAFYGCDGLKTITIPSNVKEIGKCAFYASNLETITIQEGVTSIGEAMFGYCDSLRSVTLPNSVKSIGERAFWVCTDLTSIEIPNSVTGIGEYAFSAAGLTSVSIPKSVIFIGDYAFSCRDLQDVWYQGSESDMWNIDGATSLTNSRLYNAKWHYNTCEAEHNYFGDCDSTCNNCEWTRTVTVDHSYDNICDAECNGCGLVRTILQHSFSGECDSVCDVCEWTRTVTAEHSYSSVCDAKCNVCATTRTVQGHDFTDEQVCTQCGKAKYTPGDINDSGAEPDLDDVVVLAQIVAGWQNVDHNEAALDVNSDGDTTLDDVVLLAQFVAGWGVTIS